MTGTEPLLEQGGFERVQRRSSSALSRQSVDENLHVTIDLKHINYFVGKKPKQVQILHDVNLQFRPGELVALMGPSGAGKTTLLSVILDNAAGRLQGQVLVNNTRVPQRECKSVFKLIPQEDVLLTDFTVRETFYYQSELVLPASMSRAEKDLRVMKVVQHLNLESCLDVKIGSVESRGISGGQRKRVSIGMDLLSNPAVLFVDEPTSGLDSSSAEDVVEGLRQLAHGHGRQDARTVISTIHQPSYRIFALFDKVILLVKGRVAYSGTVPQLETFFEGIGLATPPKENPADHYMRLLQDETEAERICAAHQNERKLGAVAEGRERDQDTRTTEPDASSTSSFDDQGHERPLSLRDRMRNWLCSCMPGSKKDDDIENSSNGNNILGTMMRQQKLLEDLPQYPTSKWTQFWTLFKRSSYETLKNPQKFIRMMALKAAVGVLIGIVWFGKSRPPKLQNLFPIEGALFSICLNSTVDTLAMTIIVFPSTRALMIREYKNGSYSLMAFYPALILSLGLFSVAYSLLMVVPIYTMVGLQMEGVKFVYFLLVVIIMTTIGNALGVIVGATSADLVQAQNKLMPVLAPLILFSGYVLPYDSIPVVFRPFYHISFIQHALTAMQLNQLQGLVFDLDIDIPLPNNKTIDWDIPVTGEFVLEHFLSVNPDTAVGSKVLLLLGYCILISVCGYWVIKWDLTRKTG